MLEMQVRCRRAVISIRRMALWYTRMALAVGMSLGGCGSD